MALRHCAGIRRRNAKTVPHLYRTGATSNAGSRTPSHPIVDGDGFRGAVVHRSAPMVASGNRDELDRDTGFHGFQCGERFGPLLSIGAALADAVLIQKS